MKVLLEQLFEQKKLSRKEARDTLIGISEDKYNVAQLAAFLSVFRMRPITKAELQGFRDALLGLCRKVDLRGIDSIDIVGTGGDGKNTFNISTLSSFVVAGAGYKVTKHGNYGVSSVSGSSNVMEHLGYRFSNEEDQLHQQLDKANITFLHAPLFHLAMKAVGPVRKALGMKTFFNMLGPLVNPGRPQRSFLGVFNMNLSRLYHYILQEEDKSFAVVYSLDGYDEISLTDAFSIKSNNMDRLFQPEDLGFQQNEPSSLFGGDTVAEAAHIFTTILDGKGTEAQRNAIYANAGMAISQFDNNKSIHDSIAEAKQSLDSGAAMACLKKLIKTVD